MNTPLVSVVIPVYNREDTIERAVESALSQTYENIEVIVVDDCSTDSTVSIVNQLSDIKVDLIEHEENKGGAVARNTGIQNSEGEYIAFLDSDDRWLPTKLEKQLNSLQNSDRKISYCSKYYAYGEKVLVESECSVRQGDINKDLFQGWMKPVTSSLVIHESCFENRGIFDETFPSFQEYDLMVRMTEKYEVDYVD